MDKPTLDTDFSPFLSVEEAAKLLKTTPKTLYTYCCNSGAKGGKQRKRLPEDIYIKLGRKTIFIREKLMMWVLSGAKMG